MKNLSRAVLPWPVLARCEAFYVTKFGEVELCMVRHLCRPDQDSIDVGANFGAYLHSMKRHSRRVYAFEPVPWLGPLLVKKFGRKIVVKTVALSRNAGTARLYVPIVQGEVVTGLSSLSPVLPVREMRYCEIPVETKPLDEVYAGDVGFIKIDVEGHEESVLQGARRTIARCRPRVLVEAEERYAPGSLCRISTFFRSLGYRGYFVFHRHLEPIERFDPRTMQRSEDIAGYTLGVPRRRFDRYINNFLFLPPREPHATLDRLEAALETPRPLAAASTFWPRLRRRKSAGDEKPPERHFQPPPAPARPTQWINAAGQHRSGEEDAAPTRQETSPSA